MNRKMITKMSNFVLGNGFYIALALCVALICFSGYYLLQTVSTTTNTMTPVTGTVDLEIPEVQIPVLVPEVSKPVETPEPEAPAEQLVEEIVAEEDLEELVEEETIAPVQELRFVWPSEGELTQTHSLDVLVFNPTMGDWRTHSGIDVSAAEGTAVMSVADGEVTAVFTDDMTGTTLVISHEGGLESSYCNLGEFPSVEVGDWVKCGDIIAVIGRNALVASSTESHLQFTMTQDGELVDPLHFLPEQNEESQPEISQSAE